MTDIGNPGGWNKVNGFQPHLNGAVDDNLTMQAGNRHGWVDSSSGREALQDVGRMEMEWDLATNGMSTLDDKDLVPYDVAARGARYPEHAENVRTVISGALQEGGPQLAGLEGDFHRIYNNAIAAASRGETW